MRSARASRFRARADARAHPDKARPFRARALLGVSSHPTSPRETSARARARHPRAIGATKRYRSAHPRRFQRASPRPCNRRSSGAPSASTVSCRKSRMPSRYPLPFRCAMVPRQRSHALHERTPFDTARGRALRPQAQRPPRPTVAARARVQSMQTLHESASTAPSTRPHPSHALAHGMIDSPLHGNVKPEAHGIAHESALRIGERVPALEIADLTPSLAP